MQEYKKIYSGSGTTTLVISNEEMNDIMKIVQVLEDSLILLKGVTKTNKNETKSHSGGFLSRLLGTLRSSLIADILTKSLFKGKGTVRAGEGTIRAGEGTIRAGEGNIRAREGIKKGSNSATFFNKFWNRRVL